MKSVNTSAAPAAVGPYSQAIVTGNMVYCSGQIAIDPATNTLCDGDITEQTRLVLSNLAAVLKAAGSRPEQVVKATIYLKDMNDFNAVNAVYAEMFDMHRPARACVEVSRLPKDVDVEIDAIATVTA